MSNEIETLRIDPVGFLGDKDCLIFQGGLWKCGAVKDGMGIQVGIDKGGGIISNQDLKKLELMIRRHLYQVARISVRKPTTRNKTNDGGQDG